MNRPAIAPKIADQVFRTLALDPIGLDSIHSDLRRNICHASVVSSRPDRVKPMVKGTPEEGWVSVSEMNGMKWSQPSHTHTV